MNSRALERVLDASALRSIRGLGAAGAPDPVEELCRMYVDDMSSRVSAANAAADGGDLEQVRRHAHAIKGAAGSFGAMRMFVVAARLEAIAARRGAAKAVVAELEAELGRLRVVLEGEILAH